MHIFEGDAVAAEIFIDQLFRTMLVQPMKVTERMSYASKLAVEQDYLSTFGRFIRGVGYS